MKKVLLISALLVPGILGILSLSSQADVTTGTVTVIDKIAPQAGAFTGLVNAENVDISTNAFGGNLGTGDVDLQTALETIDDLSIGGGSGSSVYPATATASFPFGLSASTITLTGLPGEGVMYIDSNGTVSTTTVSGGSGGYDLEPATVTPNFAVGLTGSYVTVSTITVSSASVNGYFNVNSVPSSAFGNEYSRLDFGVSNNTLINSHYLNFRRYGSDQPASLNIISYGADGQQFTAWGIGDASSGRALQVYSADVNASDFQNWMLSGRGNGDGNTVINSTGSNNHNLGNYESALTVTGWTGLGESRNILDIQSDDGQLDDTGATSLFSVNGATATFTVPLYLQDGSVITSTSGFGGGVGDAVLSATQTFTGTNNFTGEVNISSAVTIAGSTITYTDMHVVVVGTLTVNGVDVSGGAGAGTIEEITVTDPVVGGGTSGTVNIAMNAISLSTGVTGTLADGSLSANVALLNATQTFTGENTFAGGLTISSGTSIAVSTMTLTDVALILSGNSSITWPNATVQVSSPSAGGGSGTQSKSFTITAVTSDGDFGAIWKAPAAITITRVNVVQVGATNVVGQLQECDSDGASCAGVDSADITATSGNAADDGTLSNPSIDANDWIGWTTTSVSGTNTRLSVTFDYTVD